MGVIEIGHDHRQFASKIICNLQTAPDERHHLLRRSRCRDAFARVVAEGT
jgi:hypothetical protein